MATGPKATDEKTKKQKYTNSNKDPTGATKLVYDGLMCDTKLLDNKRLSDY